MGGATAVLCTTCGSVLCDNPVLHIQMFAPADDKAGAQLSDTLTYQATAPQVTNGIHKSNEAKKDDREVS